jgi:hypothetical protein
MKKMKWTIVGLLFILSACGSSDPFRRGPDQNADPVSSQSDQKPSAPDQGEKPPNPAPAPNSDENPNPTPTPVPAPQPEPPSPQALDPQEFNQNVLPMLQKKCDVCHENPAPTFERAEKLAVFQDLKNSELYQYATGSNNRHSVILKAGSAELLILTNWIQGLHSP